MATLSTVIANARILSRSDSNSMTDSDAIIYANVALDDWFKRLVERREDLFVQESYRDITSAEIVGGSQPGRFLLPSDNILLKSLQVNLQDSTNTNLYYEAQQVDVSNLPPGITWEYMKANQASDLPTFDYRGDWIEIAPTPTVTMTQALRIFYVLLPTYFSTTTDTIPFPYSIDISALANKIAAEYLKGLVDPLYAVFEKKYDEAVEEMIRSIAHGEQKPLTSNGLPITGYEY